MGGNPSPKSSRARFHWVLIHDLPRLELRPLNHFAPKPRAHRVGLGNIGNIELRIPLPPGSYVAYM